MSVIFAIIGLGILIVVHEAGHMTVARWCGMRVDKFSVGFGPTLVRYRGKQTVYQIALVPLGGYVQIAGMNPHENLPEDDPGSYANKSPLARFATILAGPLTNYLFAMIIIGAALAIWGMPTDKEVVGGVAEVSAGKPAGKAGMRSGDLIQSIDGKTFATNREAVKLIQAAKGSAQVFKIKRKNEILSFSITAKQSGDAFRIGIAFESVRSYQEMGIGEAARYGVVYPFVMSARVLGNFKQMFSGKVGMDQVGGPLEIVRQLTRSVEDGLARAIEFLGMLNVFLGLFNLLPVPALDGGRLVFLGYTLITRRPVNQRVETAIHTVGFFILLGLILLATFNDALRWVGSR